MQVTDGELIKVLDLGSGKGGAARWLAKTFGCHVTCFNLGEKQNEFNKSKAVADGIGELIDTHLGSFNGTARALVATAIPCSWLTAVLVPDDVPGHLLQSRTRTVHVLSVDVCVREVCLSHTDRAAEPLPQKWTDTFDMVWSQEAFCHAMDHNALIAEVQRILKPGGTAVFSDIMQSDNGGDCTSFTGQNVTTKLASPATYKVPPPPFTSS